MRDRRARKLAIAGKDGAGRRPPQASTEHLKVGTAKHVDAVYAVVEPYLKSLESGHRVFALARDLGIGHTALLADKVREGELPSVQAFAGEHGLELAGAVPYDECLHHAERAAVAPIDFSPRTRRPSSRSASLAGRLIRGAA